ERMLARFLSPAVEPELVLCSVGRLVPRKGVAWFIDEVMPTLPDDVCFLVAGEGAERGRITDAIRRHDLEDRVRLLGPVTDSDVELLYQGSDLFVMPNVRVPGDMEGFGLVLVEAGLSGLPAVVARLEGIADVVTEGQNGHLVESRDAAGFRDAVMRYYDSPSGLRDASDRAKRHTAATFGWDRVTQRYLTILEARARR
ncbi:MAG: glycosyltransferase family 4 protein, partial [Gemmatimonadaceae bacterium]